MSEHKESFWNFSFGEVVTAGFVVGFLIWVSIPNFIGGGHGSPASTCINNLRQIDAAANQFALENHLTNGDRINFPNDLTPYIKLNNQGKIPSCPAAGIYSLKKIGDAPTCSLGSTVTPAHILP